jgi:hypothetical protein
VELRPFLEGDPGPVSPALSLLREARPGQILVSHETYDHVRDLPGLQFRLLNADAHTDEATEGDTELLWTSPETYAFFAATLQEAIRKQPAPDPQDSFAVPEVAVPAESRALQPLKTKSSDIRTGAFSTARLSAIDPDEEVSWMASHRVLVSGAAVVILALAAVYALPALHKKTPAMNSSPNSVSNSGSNAAQPSPKQEPLPSANIAAVPEPAAPAKILPPVAPANNIRKAEAPKIPQSPPKPPEVKPVGEYEGFNSRDIPLLLKKAQADAGAGDYDSSRHEYDIILHLEPTNQAARAGLSRVNMSVDRDR